MARCAHSGGPPAWPPKLEVTSAFGGAAEGAADVDRRPDPIVFDAIDPHVGVALMDALASLGARMPPQKAGEIFALT